MTYTDAIHAANNAAYRALRLASKAGASADQIERLQTLAKLSDEAVDAPHPIHVSNANEQRKAGAA